MGNTLKDYEIQRSQGGLPQKQVRKHCIIMDNISILYTIKLMRVNRA